MLLFLLESAREDHHISDEIMRQKGWFYLYSIGCTLYVLHISSFWHLEVMYFICRVYQKKQQARIS